MIGYLDSAAIVVTGLVIFYILYLCGEKMGEYLFNEKVKRYEEVMK